MGDGTVESVVNFALQNLLRLLADEVNLGSNVKAKIRSLSKELEYMDAFLKSSEGKHKDNTMVVVMNQIRDVAYEAEDVVDTYVANVTLQRRPNIFNKLLHCLCQEVMLHDVDSQLQSINRSIGEIYKNKEKYNIGEDEFQSERGVEEAGKSIRERRRLVEEEVVGLVHDSTIVIGMLKEENPGLSVISIIGIGGLGKTTLTRKIYKEDEVKDNFACHAWAYVSCDYSARELLLNLLRCLNSSIFEYEDLSDEQLKEKVRECLEGKKYLVVLDDVWEIELWEKLKDAFPNDRNGSRILITSRMKHVASYCNSILTYDLPFLNEEDSWKLFRKRVFGDEEYPDNLELLGRKMVENCKGLPLSIIVLAGLVAKKDKSQIEWMRINDSINWHLAQDKIVMDLLKLSYDNLPRELKPCFLYLGIYPEDSEILANQLTRLWIVEGFIQRKENGTSNSPEPEDVADYYLDELVDRSLVQVASKRLDGSVKTCRIHDLVRDLCISESKANKFMEVGTEFDINRCSSRRLSLHCKIELLPTKYCQSHPRSLFLFADRVVWDSESKGWEWIRKTLKLVRVLDIDSVNFVSAPLGLKTLIHLRYLRVSVNVSTIGNNILTSICNLWNLEALDLFASDGVVTIPSGMWKLKRLRHVHVGGARVKPPAHMVRGENTLLSLQTLCYVIVSPELVLMMKNDFFRNLTKLSLFYGLLSLQQFPSLHHLNKLRKLKMTGFGFNLPSGANVFPPNLVKITLVEFYGPLESGFMNTLGQLPSLQILKLRSGRISGSINCVAGEFPQLEVFHMKDIKVEGQWRQEKGAMPHLRHLFLHHCEYWDEQQYLPLRNLH